MHPAPFRARGSRRARTAAVAIAAAACTCLPAPAGAAAKPKPDLAVKRVAGVSATALTGDQPALKVKVANSGKARSKASKATVRIASEIGSPLPEVIGKGKVGPIAPKRSRIVKLKATIPDSALGALKLLACVPPGTQRNDCRASSPVSVGDGSSWGLIEKARSEGELDPGEADLYGLYALTGDTRLPSAYRGNGQVPEGAVFGSIAEGWPALSEAERLVLWPYALSGEDESSRIVIQPGPEPHYGIELLPPLVSVPATFTCPDQDPFDGYLPAVVLIYTPDAEQTMTRGTRAPAPSASRRSAKRATAGTSAGVEADGNDASGAR